MQRNDILNVAVLKVATLAKRLHNLVLFENVNYSYRLTRLKPTGHYTYHEINIKKFYVLPHTVYLYVLCGSENKQRLFPYTALTDWFV